MAPICGGPNPPAEVAREFMNEAKGAMILWAWASASTFTAQITRAAWCASYSDWQISKPGSAASAAWSNNVQGASDAAGLIQ
jgi:hypothetical protein